MNLHRASLALSLSFSFALGAAAPVAAHDYWLEPTTFTSPAGELLHVRHFVGHPGDCVEKVRNAAHYERWALELAGLEIALAGRDGYAPAGSARPSTPGLGIVVYTSRPTLLELPPEKFEGYLREEGLEHVIRARAERGESSQPGRELYSRCAKALVRVTGDSAQPAGARDDELFAGYDRAVGLPLELVPVGSPFGLSGHAPWLVELLYEGRPLPRALVELMPLAGDLPAVRVRTDERGRAELAPPPDSQGWSGGWLAHAVHMVPADTEARATRPAADTGPRAEAHWRSYWTSLTFGISKAPLPMR